MPKGIARDQNDANILQARRQLGDSGCRIFETECCDGLFQAVHADAAGMNADCRAAPGDRRPDQDRDKAPRACPPGIARRQTNSQGSR